MIRQKLRRIIKIRIRIRIRIHTVHPSDTYWFLIPRCKCLYCDHEFSGGATRFTEHILGKKGGVACTKVPASVKAAMQLRAAVALEAKATKGKLASATAVGVDLSLHRSFPSRYSCLKCHGMCLSSGRGGQDAAYIEAFSNKRTKDELDDAVATYFFSSPIAFNAAFKAMIRMVNEAAPGYKPP